MKIECLKDKFKKALTLSEKSVGKNLSLPILSSVVLVVKNGKTFLKSTNLETGLEVEFSSKIKTEGKVAFNPSVVLGVLTNIKNNEIIELEKKDNILNIITSSGLFTVKTYSLEDFPVIPKINSNNIIYIKSVDFINSIKSVIFAASISDIKPEISSIYINYHQNNLFFVATDSFRLAEKSVSFIDLKGDIDSIIVPFKNINNILRVFEGVEDDLKLSITNNQISIYSSTIHLTSRIIDGIYPDYNQIMPKLFDWEININREEFIQALKISNIFSDKFNQILITLNPKQQKINLESENQDVGTGKIEINVNILKQDNQERKIRFNAKYLLDCFQIINSDDVFLGLNETNQPIMIKESNNETFKYIVMPINR
jgi:DNA polymerase III subunit beta